MRRALSLTIVMLSIIRDAGETLFVGLWFPLVANEMTGSAVDRVVR